MIQCSSPDKVHSYFIRALLNNDIDGALSLYHPNAVFVTGEGGAQVSGETEIRKQLLEFQEMAAVMELVSKSIYQADDSVLVVVNWKRADIEGVSYTAVDVLKKNNQGYWQFLIDNPYGV